MKNLSRSWKFVLISTYWNVNLGIVVWISVAFCFNLNLLECKSNYWVDVTDYNEVLISTYWNVNVVSKAKANKINYVLISTYWNVNNSVKYGQYLDTVF